MKKILVLALLAIQGIAGALAAEVSIMPQPVKLEIAEGEMVISPKTTIILMDNSLRSTAQIFADDIAVFFDSKPLKVCSSHRKATDKSIYLALNNSLAAEEYSLLVNTNGTLIEGGSAAGVFYGLQSLRQMIIQTDGKVPYCTIEDKPTFAYRGVHLDVCRHFFTVEEVKEYIDIIAAHKVNRFHFHLTDDQGWRIEIKRYPELTKVGSVRTETLVGHGGSSNEYDGTPYGGYYTQKQLRDIVKYAAERHITVIPEIEMPGHARGALAALPWLGCTDEYIPVWTRWGVTPEIMCAGKETTYEFLENVLAEVIEIFPSEYIHIGGDEAPRNRWKECPHCQERIKAEGLASEAELQSYLVARIEKYLHAHGRKMIGWDEILEGGVTPTATIMSWQGARGGINAAKKGNYVVMTPNSHLYFDFYQTETKEGEPLAIGGYLPVEKVYQYNPYRKLNDEEKKYILGVQCNLWTEYIGEFDHLTSMLLPRLAALSDVQWAEDRRNEETLRPRMEQMRKLYDCYGWNYAKFYYEGRK